MTPEQFERVEADLVDAGVPPEFVIPVALLAEELEVLRAVRAGVDPPPAVLGGLVGEMLEAVGVDPVVAVPGDLLLLADVVRSPAQRPDRRRREFRGAA